MSDSNPGFLYRSIWRWHFYAGLFCIPFVLILSVTGAIYLFKPYYEAWLEPTISTESQGVPHLSPNQQIEAAVKSVPGGKFFGYRVPAKPTDPVLIQVQAQDAWAIYINPTTGEILKKQLMKNQLMSVVKTLHGELLVGTVGSILVELAACWAIVLIITGLYLGWPRSLKSWGGIFYPRITKKGRLFWRDLHAVTGLWIALLALFLLISGLPWALVWGKALTEVRAFEFNAAPADWSQGRHQEHQQWRSIASETYNLTDAVLASAIQLQLAPPVFLNQDDAPNNIWKATSQAQNRPQREDVWLTGEGAIQKRSAFGEKLLLDRIVGVGVAAHEGQLFGVFNLLLGLITCLGLMMLSLSGFILWRKRKPVNALGAPAAIKGSVNLAIIAITLGLALVLPLMGLSLMAIILIEFAILRRFEKTRVWLGLNASKNHS